MFDASTARWPNAPRYAPRLTTPEVSGTEFAVFAQDRWRVNDRLMSSSAPRLDRDGVVERVNYSPRVGMAVSVLAEGRGILRGGLGKFAERTPLTVGAFTQYDRADGHPLRRGRHAARRPGHLSPTSSTAS